MSINKDDFTNQREYEQNAGITPFIPDKFSRRVFSIYNSKKHLGESKASAAVVIALEKEKNPDQFYKDCEEHPF